MKSETVHAVLDILVEQIINDKKISVPDNATQEEKEIITSINQAVIAIKEHFKAKGEKPKTGV